mgnify:CR=1 FL=1
MKYTNINYKVVYLHLYWIFDILFKALQLSEHHKRHFSSNSGSLSNGVVLTKSHFRKCFGISFFALLNDLTDILLDEDTHPKVTESLESKSYSFDYFDKVVLSLQFSV